MTVSTSNSTNDQNVVTLATLAAHLGVSRSTVSNAYNHPDQLSPALRQRILQTAAGLGYNGPDPVARRLRQKHAGAIGILFSEPLQHAFTDTASVLFLEGVAAAGEEADSGMLLIPARPSEENAAVVQNAIVDGFILYSIPPGHPFVDAALKRRVPVVCVDQTRIGGVSWVGIDDFDAAKRAANHLIELGHRDIGVIVYGLSPSTNEAPDSPGASPDGSIANGPIANGTVQSPTPSVSRLRLNGYEESLRSAGIDWDGIQVRECERNTVDAGLEAARVLLDTQNPPTAILCTSDTLAFGAIQAAKERGIGVPDRLSVVGFNDLPGAVSFDPPLTTVRQPLTEKGSVAAKLLLPGANQQQNETIFLDAELVIRSSTAPPA